MRAVRRIQLRELARFLKRVTASFPRSHRAYSALPMSLHDIAVYGSPRYVIVELCRYSVFLYVGWADAAAQLVEEILREGLLHRPFDC